MPTSDPTSTKRVAPDGAPSRLGLSIPYGWWPAAPILKEIEAAGFRFVQIPSPPPSVLVNAKEAARHAVPDAEEEGEPAEVIPLPVAPAAALSELSRAA
jgi:hypothetical protein